jgi:glycosyltransferase involved in cell wall biosynthesis
VLHGICIFGADIMNTSETLRVLFINDTSRDGGPGRSLHALLRHLDPRRVQRTVLLPRPGPIADLLRADGVADEIVFEDAWIENLVAPLTRPMERADHRAPLATRAFRAAGNALKSVRLLQRLAARAHGYDLVYGNGTTANFLAAAAAARAGVPVLWHVRYTGVPWATVALHRRLAGSATVRRIVCVSRPSAALFPGIEGKVQVVPNALDLGAFTPGAVAPQLRREMGWGADTVVFASAGRILRRKGYEEMIRAARLMLDSLTMDQRSRCGFAIIGDTPPDFAEDHRAACVALAQQLGVADQVRFLGFRSDVRPYLGDADVVVVPSVYADPLPRAVIEGMALGKPIVAFGVGGIGEMLDDDVEGTLVSGTPPDVAGLAAAMLRAFREPERRRQQGAAARARVLRDFDGRRHAARIESLIQEAAAPVRDRAGAARRPRA